MHPTHTQAHDRLRIAGLACTGLDEPWTRVQRRILAFLRGPEMFLQMRELSEWYWDACVEEAADDDATALRASALARANFDAIAMFDADAGNGHSAALRVLGSGRLDEDEQRVLARALEARPRLFRVGIWRPDGLRMLEDVSSQKRVTVREDGWPVELHEGDLAIGRVLGFGPVVDWIGPVLPLPPRTPEELLTEVRDGLVELCLSHECSRRTVTERFLVDLHHQWFTHVFVPELRRDRASRPPTFALLRGRGRVRPSG